jgi:chromosome segregation ATPase
VLEKLQKQREATHEAAETANRGQNNEKMLKHSETKVRALEEQLAATRDSLRQAVNKARLDRGQVTHKVKVIRTLSAQIHKLQTQMVAARTDAMKKGAHLEAEQTSRAALQEKLAEQKRLMNDALRNSQRQKQLSDQLAELLDASQKKSTNANVKSFLTKALERELEYERRRAGRAEKKAGMFKGMYGRLKYMTQKGRRATQTLRQQLKKLTTMSRQRIPALDEKVELLKAELATQQSNDLANRPPIHPSTRQANNNSAGSSRNTARNTARKTARGTQKQPLPWPMPPWR